MDDLETVTFEPWAVPDTDVFGEPVDGAYSRLAWLPTIGPSSWLIWSTLAAQLHREPQVTWALDQLGLAHGLGHGTGAGSSVRRTLARLQQFRLLAAEEDQGHQLVRLTAPPVRPRTLERLPGFVRVLHDQTFPVQQLAG